MVTEIQAVTVFYEWLHFLIHLGLHVLAESLSIL